MRDPRFNQLANNIVEYSLNVQAGHKVLIDMIGEERELLLCLIDAVYARGGMPFVELEDKRVTRRLLHQASEEQMKLWAEYDLKRMEMMDAYVGIRSGNNVNELSDVPGEQSRLFDIHYKRPIHSERRVKHTNWVVMRYPNASMAQLSNKSTEAFEDFYFNVCNLDYRKMSEAMDALVAYMEKTDRVRLVAPGTDLSFSIKGIPAVKCDGKLNIPDGEVFTAPVRHSVQGTIRFNVASIYSGTTFEDICFRFENGKIVEANSNEPERLQDILDTDEGARYIGEFSLGINPYIQHPMKDILFDEKIDGSLHFTPGQAYDEADNGNRSSIHWDLVQIQRADYGGGEIYFDDKLIRKDGRFVVPELIALNPEHLK